MTAFDAILFDLDGVIIDSEPLHEQSIRLTSAHLGNELPDAALVRFKGLVESAGAALLREYNPGTNLTAEEIIAYRDQIYRQLFDERVELIPGVLDFLRLVRTLRLRTALATSALASNQQRAFAKFSLAPYFDAVITGADVVHGKPHPEPYLKSAAALGVKPTRSLVVEDSVNGILAGVAAGCTVAALTTSFGRERLEQAGAHWTVDSFSELGRRLVAAEAPAPVAE